MGHRCSSHSKFVRQFDRWCPSISYPPSCDQVTQLSHQTSTILPTANIPVPQLPPFCNDAPTHLLLVIDYELLKAGKEEKIEQL
ncbi:hypothetical protein L218DRAFT_1059714 [Marasmius fiardii PR-910]|nr:hypothetical protein L218DRAFT_1059714 [Marasmius fiardii PR-910]